MEKSAKIYIAGHHGLVGSAIWRNLQEKGYTNLTGRSHKELDLLDGVAVKDFFDQERPEYVILAAAHVGGIMANSTYRADFIYKNLQIQQNVIGESFRHGVKKLLFLGSTCIYPRDAQQPMKEDALLTSPLEYTNEPYAIAKIAGLKMCESFNLQYGTNYIAVMPTNLYGPNDNFDLERSHVLPAMIRKIHLAKCLNEGDWENIRYDLDMRPVEGINGESRTEEILAVLKSYGISKDGVELWGTGTPLREFLWIRQKQINLFRPHGSGPDAISGKRRLRGGCLPPALPGPAVFPRKDQDQQAPHDGGGQRTHQDRDLAAVDQIGVGEGQRIDEQRHREPDTAQAGHGQQHAPRRPLGQLRKTRPHGSPAGKEDAQRLAEDKTEEDAHAD